MKWLFYVIVLIYMLYKTVYGYKPALKDSRRLTIEPIDYGSERNFYLEGVRKTITCKGAPRNQKVEWVDPSGQVVRRVASNRVFAQEHFVPSYRTRIPALVLIFNSTAVEDTGEWTCRSEETKQNVSLCIIDPSKFVDTQSEVTVDRGRAITLSCQARGNPEPRILWYRNGEILTDEINQSKYKVMTKYNSQGFEGLLTIVSLNSEDSGIYTCTTIQESVKIEDCSASTSINITLHINYAPEFEDGNDTVLVSSNENESIDLVCAANGYPTPTYRWFKEFGEVLSEYSKDEIRILNDGAKAVLTLFANASTFGQRYRCHATNQYGDAVKVFTLIELKSPIKPNEISIINSTQDNLLLKVKWDGEVLFPIDGVHIQYLKEMSKKMGGLTEQDWKQANETEVKNITFDALASLGMGDLSVTLQDLNKETEYYLRLRAFNGAGVSPWSEPVLARTAGELEEDASSSEAEEATEPTVVDEGYSEGIFYGLFFTAGVIILAVGCMFVVRFV